MEESPAPIAAPEPATGQAADPIPNLTPVSSPAPALPESEPREEEHNDASKDCSAGELEGDENECLEEVIKDAPTNAEDALVPKIGMTFDSINEAFHFYKAYGYFMGFGVRRRTSHNFLGDRYRSTFTCCKGGSAILKKKNTKYRTKPAVKTECKAMMVIRDRHLENRWKVEVVELEHNHPLEPDMVRFMKCFRELPASVKGQLQINDKVAESINKSIDAAIAPGVGYKNCLSAEKDCTNHAEEARKLRLGEGDVEALLKFFDSMQAQNSNFFYSWDMDDEGQLRNIFWADARSRAAYRYFNDIITFDTRYLTKQYDLPLALFVGVNHHGQSILLGCGLLADETADTCIWLFRKWLRCMSDKPPDAIITDQCKTIGGAVAEVLPHARHRFCLWHIMRKLPEKIGKMEKRKAISDKLSEVVYDSLTVTDFQRGWAEMIEQFQLQDNEWLSTLYEDRSQWVPVYVKDTFWASMSTMQKNESNSSYFDGYVTSKTSIRMFIEQYEHALRSKYEKEVQEDFRSFSTNPNLLSELEFEKQIAEVYTTNIFQEFQVEVKHLMQCISVIVDRNGPIVTHKVTELAAGKKIDYKVTYNTTEQVVWCICKSFQFRGILCRHALCVLRQELVTVLPSKYILPRWRKDFKWLNASSSSPSIASLHEMDVYDDLYMHGHQFLMDIVEIGAVEQDLKEFALMVLKEAREKVMKYEEPHGDRRVGDNNMSSTSQLGSSCHIPAVFDLENDASPMAPIARVLNPTQSHPKACSPMKRLVSQRERAIQNLNPVQVKNSRSNNSTSASVHGQEIQPNEAWAMTPIGMQEGFGHMVGSISMNWTMHSPAPYPQWPESGSLDPSRRM
ncbi:protein FAR1-RELATED SEQUENCE 6 [Cocos nucifera]|uniref:Protein FAR1-RELATED SEQUENCE n=1 Tax=Cocos nucifera TaxID=13894 RepID=A0A8K0HVI2_COCNU|nr:protein FAR1-RELATED SEQUENCE 6 [Cocos nucifera]